MKKYIFSILIFTIITFIASSQEIVTGLQINPVIKNTIKNKQIPASSLKSTKLKEITPIYLPFFDDFKSKGIFPDTARWIDNYAYVNSDFPLFSANIGAATLDAIDETGSLYPDASVFPFIADHLTSKPIRLDSVFNPVQAAIKIEDSLYFSFYYQPQGRANAPEAHDSLVLEFGYYSGDSVFSYVDSIWITLTETLYPGDSILRPCDLPNDSIWIPIYETLYAGWEIRLPCDSVYIPEIEWNRIWSSPGMTLDTFKVKYGTYCRQVMIPITDSATYFRKDFHFRFYNYASLASDNLPSWRSNVDEWNVDYVYLNINRTQGDTIYRDVSFVERAPSMLQKYQSMPYNQYRKKPTVEVRDTLRLYITNLDTTTFNTSYKYYLTSEDGSFSRIYDGGNCNLPPFYSFGYQNCENCPKHACPVNHFLFPLGGTDDSAAFEIKHVILGDITATDTIGDTIYFNQKFYNYYAYDDGTPEEGYGLTPAYSKLAYRFQLNEADTLRAVKMFFNHTLNNANEQYFYLTVWKDNNGLPGEVIYSSYSIKPVFEDSLYEFHTYYLDSIVPVSGIFYVGWIQTTDDNLNIGLDRYNNARENIFYNTSGEWMGSLVEGSLLIRPVLGKKIHDYPVPPVKSSNTLIIQPNPAKSAYFVKLLIPKDFCSLSDYDDLIVNIFNLYGQSILTSRFKENFYIPQLSKGMYIVRVINTNNNSSLVNKLIISQ